MSGHSNKRQQNKLTFLFLLIFVSLAFFRLHLYGDPRQSIGGSDTLSFIESAQKPFLSWEFFTARRTPTMNVLFKLLEPPSGYELSAVSEPASNEPYAKDPIIQKGLDRVAMGQMIFSIFGWGFLAYILYYFFNTPIFKISIAVLVLVFAFSPQLATWDAVLLSESLSFSMFALFLGITILLAFRYYEDGKRISRHTYLILVIWLFVFTLWVFIRDSNAYLIFITVPLLFLFAILAYGKKSHAVLPILITAFYLLAVFIFHSVTLGASERWLNPFIQNMRTWVEPYNTRVQFFLDRGLPLEDYDHDWSYQIFKSGEVREWVYSRGYRTYTLFLLDNPRWALQRFVLDLETSFSENMQPYYTLKRNSTPQWLIPLGNIFHPTSSSVLLVDILFTLFIFYHAVHIPSEKNIIWAGIVIWLLAGEGILFFVSYHGDPYGVIRHTLVATMPLRLSVWVLMVLVFDLISSPDNSRQYPDRFLDLDHKT